MVLVLNGWIIEHSQQTVETGRPSPSTWHAALVVRSCPGLDFSIFTRAPAAHSSRCHSPHASEGEAASRGELSFTSNRRSGLVQISGAARMRAPRRERRRRLVVSLSRPEASCLQWRARPLRGSLGHGYATVCTNAEVAATTSLVWATHPDALTLRNAAASLAFTLAHSLV